MLKKTSRLRNCVQVVFALVVLYTGIRFISFVNNYTGHGSGIEVSHPAAVEGFLPISAMVSLKAWTATGEFDKIHPAGLVIFLTVIAISLLFKKAFCAWICPIGNLSEVLAKCGKFFFGRNFKLPAFLDYPLRSLKYLLLLFFVSSIFLFMDGQEAASFLKTPYNMIADVKMLQFFQHLSNTALVTIGILLIFSVLLENFWCRYLCPYGALLGLISLLSPWKVSRSKGACIDCRACNKACPNQINVSMATRIWSPECSGCLKCVNACEVKGALSFKMRSVGWSWILSPKNTAIALIVIWLLFVLTAKLTGHWQTAITPDMYRDLVPRAAEFGH